MEELTKCPYCSSAWESEEIAFQQCDNCGYPLSDGPEEEEYDAEIDDDLYD